MSSGYVSHNDTTTHTAAYKLFHYYYGFLVPDGELYGANELDYFGLPTAESEEQAAAIASELQPKQLRPFEMAALAARGCPWGVVSPSCAAEIYKTIIQHLNDWLRAIERHQVADWAVPYEGLREFNIMAAALYDVAACHGLLPKNDKVVADDGMRRLTRPGATFARSVTYKHDATAFSLIEAAHFRSKRSTKGEREDSVFSMSENGKLSSADKYDDGRTERRRRKIGDM